jgi:hypothetical protein
MLWPFKSFSLSVVGYSLVCLAACCTLKKAESDIESETRNTKFCQEHARIDCNALADKMAEGCESEGRGEKFCKGLFYYTAGHCTGVAEACDIEQAKTPTDIHVGPDTEKTSAVNCSQVSEIIQNNCEHNQGSLKITHICDGLREKAMSSCVENPDLFRIWMPDEP